MLWLNHYKFISIFGSICTMVTLLKFITPFTAAASLCRGWRIAAGSYYASELVC